MKRVLTFLVKLVVLNVIYFAIFGLFWFYTPDRIYEPELNVLAEEYVADARKYGYDVGLEGLRSIQYADLKWVEKYAIGFGMPPHVFIDEEYAKTAKPHHLKELIYHELTHSLFKCMHSEYEDSIMYSGGTWLSQKQLNKGIEKLFLEDIPKLKCFNNIKRL